MQILKNFGSIILALIILSACQMERGRSPNSATGQPIRTLYFGLEIPVMIDVDSNHLYWASKGQQIGGSRPTWNLRILQMNNDGSNLKTLVAKPYAAWDMTMDDTHIYWIGPDGILKVPKEGGKVISLVDWPIPSDLTQELDIAVDDTYVYWASCRDKSISKIEKVGGVSRIILTGFCPSAILPVSDYLYWAEGVIRIGRIMRINKDGGQVTELATQQDWPTEMIGDKKYLYWINENDPEYQGEFLHGAIMRMSLGGGSPTKLVSINIPSHLAIDDRFVYWVSSNGIEKVSKDGGETRTLTTVVNVVEDLAVDDKHVYFVIPNERSVYVVDKE